jgi:uncharacterized protein
MQRGATPRVYRNMLVFLSAENKQLDNLKDAMRSALAWTEIVQEKQRLNLTQSDSALADAKAIEAAETVKTRMKEAWCYLIYPWQESAQAEIEWQSSKVSAQDSLLARASKKLVSDEGLLPELGPNRLDGDLKKYIWNENDHLFLKDLWEYLNRYTYLPRLKNRETLVKTIHAAVSGMLPGPFAYAERWDKTENTYRGLLINSATSALIVVDNDSVIVDPNVAERHRPKGEPEPKPPGGGPDDPPINTPPPEPEGPSDPTRFIGTVMVSSDRPSRDLNQIVEAVVEQLTSIPGSDVSLKFEIDAEVPDGIDRSKVRTILENANTLGFIDKNFNS